MSDTENNSDTGNDSDNGTISTTKPKSNTLSIISTIAIWGFILALLVMVILMLVFGYQKDLPKRLFPETDVEGDLIVQGKLARYIDNVVEVDSGTKSFTLKEEDSGKIYYINDPTTRTITLPSNCKSGTNYRIIILSPNSGGHSNTEIVTVDTAHFYGQALSGVNQGNPSIFQADGDTVLNPNRSGDQNPYRTTSQFIKTGTNWDVSVFIMVRETPTTPFS